MGPSSDEPGHLGVDGGNPATRLEELYGGCESRGIPVPCGGAGGGRWAAERDTGVGGGKPDLQAAGGGPGGALGSAGVCCPGTRGPRDPRCRGLGLSRWRAPQRGSRVCHLLPQVTPSTCRGSRVPARALLDHPGRSPPASFLSLAGWEAVLGVGRAGLAWLRRAKSGA